LDFDRTGPSALPLALQPRGSVPLPCRPRESTFHRPRCLILGVTLQQSVWVSDLDLVKPGRGFEETAALLYDVDELVC